jgi:hypothetical protein
VEELKPKSKSVKPKAYTETKQMREKEREGES